MKKIPLTQGKVAIIDDEDFERVGRHKWYAHRCSKRTYYARRNIYQKGGGKIIQVSMASFILSAPAGLQVDHINHDTLDNRWCNLRLCTRTQNNQNRKPFRGGTSKYKGVCWNRENKNWRALCCEKGRLIHLGYFKNEKQAAMAYDEYASEHFVEFARLNRDEFPGDFD